MNNVKGGQSSIHGWEMSGTALPAIISGHGGWIPVSRTWQASTTVRHKYAVRFNLMVIPIQSDFLFLFCMFAPAPYSAWIFNKI